MSIRVVVADDFPLMRGAVVRALSGVPEIDVVAEASDGEEAVALVEEHHPDVLVLDLAMPQLGGLGVLTRLQEEDAATRVLVVTASEQPETVAQAVAAGAAGYVTKRATLPQLCDAVATVHAGGAAISPSLTGGLLRALRGEGPAAARAQAGLAPREREVLGLVAEGLTDDQIAERLFISARTVQAHLARVRDKVGVRRRSQLVRWATEHDMV